MLLIFIFVYFAGCKMRQNSDFFSLFICNHFFFRMMSIRRMDSQAEHQRFFKLKELHYFKILLRHYDLSLIKDYFQASLHSEHLTPNTSFILQHSLFVYVPAEDCHISTSQTNQTVILREGYKIDDSLDEIKCNCGVQLYCLSRKTELILQKLYFLSLPLMQDLKNSRKFSFLQRCEVQELHFNCFAYRKGEQIEAIYYIIEGQIKMMKDCGQKIYEIVSLEQGKLFGLFELKNNCKQRQLYARAGLNYTQILKIPLKVVEQISSDREITVESALGTLKSQLYSITKTSDSLEKKHGLMIDNKKETVLTHQTANHLTRKIKTFQSSLMVNNKVLENLVQSKNLLFKIKDLNEKIHSQNSQRDRWFEVENIQAIKHFNDKWRNKKDKSRLDKTSRTQCQTLRLSYTSQDKRKKGFGGLMKYPAVQRFLRSDVSSTDYKQTEASRSQL